MAAEVRSEVKIDDFLCRWSCDDSWEEFGLLFDLEGDPEEREGGGEMKQVAFCVGGDM